jgi:hypothetical protein
LALNDLLKFNIFYQITGGSMLKFIIVVVVIFFLPRGSSADTTSFDFVRDIIRQKLDCKSVAMHVANDKNRFFANIVNINDSSFVLAGGLGVADQDSALACQRADNNAALAAIELMEGRFNSDKPIIPIKVNTASAQKGKWLITSNDYFICIEVLDVDKISCRALK